MPVSVKSPKQPRTPPPTPPRQRRFSVSEIPDILQERTPGSPIGVTRNPAVVSLNDSIQVSYAESGKAKSEALSFQETMAQMKDTAKRTRDSVAMFNYAKYLFSSAEKIHEDYTQLGLEIPEDERAARIQRMAEHLEQEALRLIKQLAVSGARGFRQPLAEAQFMLGEFLGNGSYGVKRNLTRSFGLYIQASKQNHAEAAFRVAICYELGVGTKKDDVRAVQFYRKAASFGYELAMHKLALILLYGKLSQRRNLKEGIVWLKRAANGADAGHPQALHDLAQCFEKERGCPILIPDEYYAFELYSRAANFHWAPAQYRLGSCYELGILGVQKDPGLSITWYGKAAAQGYTEAELALAGWYLDGAPGILTPDEFTSFRWVKKAAESGYPKALYVLAGYYDKAIGVRRDREEARRLYTEAASKGFAKAKGKLVEMDQRASGGAAKKERCALM